jgi:hypothetical protein
MLTQIKTVINIPEGKYCWSNNALYCKFIESYPTGVYCKIFQKEIKHTIPGIIKCDECLTSEVVGVL